MTDDKRYHECMAEIIDVLQKYDMAGAITVVAKNSSMFKYHFPTWSCIIPSPGMIRFSSESQYYPAHVIERMRDFADNTLRLMKSMNNQLNDLHMQSGG